MDSPIKHFSNSGVKHTTQALRVNVGELAIWGQSSAKTGMFIGGGSSKNDEQGNEEAEPTCSSWFQTNLKLAVCKPIVTKLT